jgi:hypothetical protein
MNVDCGDTGDGRCLTASWERAFRVALLTSVDATVGPSVNEINDASVPLDDSSSETEDKDNLIDAVPLPGCAQAVFSQTVSDAVLPSAHGRPCCDCSQRSIALYRRGDDLICKECRRRPKTVVQQR